MGTAAWRMAAETDLEVVLSSTVVVGVDGLRHGLVVAGVADRLAGRLGAGLVLVHVVDEDVVPETLARVATERDAALESEAGDVA
jgi:nucleotide-binding universal stress UspA family protein